ncbi:hypothetical protein ACSBOB_20720 [Mesorhizobium sp. ASY16-5R]|uniref:hypothetical protein n=1 Tax=Mesorhizobium sp. ASY16-5R TaxID=3445772 RepID=UPI003FA0DE8D
MGEPVVMSKLPPVDHEELRLALLDVATVLRLYIAEQLAPIESRLSALAARLGEVEKAADKPRVRVQAGGREAQP